MTFNCMRISLNVTWCFFPCCLYIFFVFNFYQFDYYMSQYVSPWVYHVWDSLNLSEYFLPHIREIFNYNVFKNFSELFFFSSSGIPIIWMLVHLLLSQQSLRLSLIVFILFSLFCFSVYFHHSIFQLTCLLFCLSYSASGSL